jgi:predicted metalloprotease with PDZ domain
MIMKKLILFCLCFFFIGCFEGGILIAQQEQDMKTNQTSKALTKLQHGIVFDDYWEYAKPGEPQTNTKLHVVVKYVKPNSEASKAGFMVGDEVMEVNDELPWRYNWNRVLMEGNIPVVYTMRRGHQEYKANLNPI